MEVHTRAVLGFAGPCSPPSRKGVVLFVDLLSRFQKRRHLTRASGRLASGSLGEPAVAKGLLSSLSQQNEVSSIQSDVASAPLDDDAEEPALRA